MITIYTFVEALWLIWPFYAANGLAPLARGKRPVDGGRKFRGKPVFGPGKTWEGLALGVIAGTMIATLQMLVYPYLPWGISDTPLTIIPMTPLLGFLMGLGAMLGDMGGSFIKRRLGIRRGRPAPLLDQLDFVIGVFLFTFFLVPWQLAWVVIILVMTPVIHLSANFIGYLLRLKSVPY